jgi:hypothetical protein
MSKRTKSFPLFFAHNKKSKFSTLDRAISRASNEMMIYPKLKLVQIIRRADEKLMGIVTRADSGLTVEWFARGTSIEDVILSKRNRISHLQSLH